MEVKMCIKLTCDCFLYGAYLIFPVGTLNRERKKPKIPLTEQPWKRKLVKGTVRWEIFYLCFFLKGPIWFFNSYPKVISDWTICSLLELLPPSSRIRRIEMISGHELGVFWWKNRYNKSHTTAPLRQKPILWSKRLKERKPRIRWFRINYANVNICWAGPVPAHREPSGVPLGRGLVARTLPAVPGPPPQPQAVPGAAAAPRGQEHPPGLAVHSQPR